MEGRVVDALVAVVAISTTPRPTQTALYKDQRASILQHNDNLCQKDVQQSSRLCRAVEAYLVAWEGN